jgi:hypothetical protein
MKKVGVWVVSRHSQSPGHLLNPLRSDAQNDALLASPFFELQYECHKSSSQRDLSNDRHTH